MAEPAQLTVDQALNLARQLVARRQLAESESICRQILARLPLQPEALRLLAMIAMQVSEPAIAIQCLTRCTSVLPRDADVRLELGNALLTAGRADEAVAAYRLAIELNPSLGGAHSSLGVALFETRRIEEAMTSLRRAVELDPTSPQAKSNLGLAQRLRGDLSGAAESFKDAVAMNRDAADPLHNLAMVYKDAGFIEHAMSSLRETVRLAPHSAGFHSSLCLAMLYDPAASADQIFAEHRRWNSLHAVPLAPKTSLSESIDRSPDRRLRIGYVSADLREHAVSYFFEYLLACHDQEHFEVFCYADLLRRRDAVTERIRGHAQQWRNITGASDHQCAEQIRADQIDILVDLAGHTDANRLLVFARKPAPIQFTYLGYPATSGLDQIDYRFTDAKADPLGGADVLHSEKLIRLPRTFLCYRPPDDAPPVRALPAVRSKRITFGSFNILAKLNPKVISLWARLLHAVPASKLMIKANGVDDPMVQDHLTELFAKDGINSDRLDFRARVDSFVAHLNLYNDVDIALDPFPYNGTTTTCEALWMGVPVLTLAGDMHAGRVGVSLMTTIGLPELIASDEAQYIEVGRKLAMDVKRLAELRTGMRDRMRFSPLMAGIQFARDVEQEYRGAWRRWCDANRGNPPR